MVLLLKIRGGIGMGLSWAVVAFLLGGIPELIGNIWPNSVTSAVDIWPAALAIPAFLGGVGFSIVLAVAGKNTRFEELSLGRFAIFGAIGGALASSFPALLLIFGLGSPNVPIGQITLALLGPLSVGGAVAALITLVVARMSENRDLLDAKRDIDRLPVRD